MKIHNYNKLWVIEVLKSNGWYRQFVYFNRAQARLAMAGIKQSWPAYKDEQLRVTCYIPAARE